MSVDNALQTTQRHTWLGKFAIPIPSDMFDTESTMWRGKGVDVEGDGVENWSTEA